MLNNKTNITPDTMVNCPRCQRRIPNIEDYEGSCPHGCVLQFEQPSLAPQPVPPTSSDTTPSRTLFIPSIKK